MFDKPDSPDFFYASLSQALTFEQATELVRLTGLNVLAFTDTKEVQLFANLPQYDSPEVVECRLKTALESLAQQYGFSIILFRAGSYPRQRAYI